MFSCRHYITVDKNKLTINGQAYWINLKIKTRIMGKSLGYLSLAYVWISNVIMTLPCLIITTDENVNRSIFQAVSLCHMGTLFFKDKFKTSIQLVRVSRACI